MTTSGRSDGPLVSRAREGDETAWADLYQLHGRRLVVWLSSVPTGDIAAAPEDLASDAWMVAASKINDFRGTDDEFGGWLVGIARNGLFNARRRAARRRTDPTEDAGVDEIARDSRPDDHLAMQDATRTLLSHLSPREAEVIACIDVVGLDVAATAAALGMNPTAVRVARHRALGRLRKLYDPAGG